MNLDNIDWSSFVDLSYSDVTELPKGLKKIGGCLDLQHSNITQLPEGLKVGHIFTSSKLTASDNTKNALINNHKNAVDWFEDISPKLKRLHAMKWKI